MPNSSQQMTYCLPILTLAIPFDYLNSTVGKKYIFQVPNIEKCSPDEFLDHCLTFPLTAARDDTDFGIFNPKSMPTLSRNLRGLVDKSRL